MTRFKILILGALIAAAGVMVWSESVSAHDTKYYIRKSKEVKEQSIKAKQKAKANPAQNQPPVMPFQTVQDMPCTVADAKQLLNMEKEMAVMKYENHKDMSEREFEREMDKAVAKLNTPGYSETYAFLKIKCRKGVTKK